MYYIEEIQIFGMNMPFISSCEAKNAYFMSGVASGDEINGIFSSKNLNFHFSIYHFKRNRFFCSK